MTTVNNTNFLLTINNKPIISKNNNYNIIQICNENNINIPKFCYHQELSIAGNCRMCLVEVQGIQKPIASCAIPITNGMTIFTNSKLVKKAREGILEFILINHPLDCPICDQGGECDLQDQSLVFGSDKGRFYEYKRSVNDKDCGPFIKTIMTRCIHCTRCIRFLDEISGFKYLGLIGRGNKIEVSNFVSKSIYSELSGNIVDLCPVGALTLKTYSFKARPWELNSFNSIDLLDPFQVNIRIDIRDSKILRILPVYNNIINTNWITDTTRYAFDGLNNFRLTNPMCFVNGKFLSISWLKTINHLSNLLQNNDVNFVLGNFLDTESVLILKKISSLKFRNSNIIFNLNNFKWNRGINDFRDNYFISTHCLTNISNYDNILLIDLNIRLSNPLLNLKIKNFAKNKGNVFSIGSSVGNNFNIHNYDTNFESFLNLFKGKSSLNFLLQNKKNLCLINNKLFNNNFMNNWYYMKNFIRKFIDIDFINYNPNPLQNNLFEEINLNNSLVKFNDISFKSTKKNLSNYDVNPINYFLNTNLSRNLISSSYNIYQGSNYFNIKKFDFLLPSVNFLEKNGSYVNFLGYYQKTKFILYPPKNSRNDWKILYILFNSLFSKKLNFHDIVKIKYNYNLFYNNSFLTSKFFYIKKYYINIFSVKNKKLNNGYFNIYTANQLVLSSKNIFNIFKKIKTTNSNYY